MTIAVLTAQSAPVTQWPLRLALVGVVVAVIVLVLLAMRRGWRNRAQRQDDLPAPLSTAPAPWTPSAAPAAGLYLGSTTAGDWLDRIVVHEMGVRSRADLSVGSEGIWLRRTGARDVFIPRTDLRGVRLERGIAGKAFERDGVVVITWELGGRLIDTGFRADLADDHGLALERVRHVLVDEGIA